MIKVEAVQWLSDSQQHEICDVYNIVDRSLSGGSKKVLEPFGRFLDFHASDCDSGISRTSLLILYSHCHGTIGAVCRESGCIRHRNLRIFSLFFILADKTPFLCLEIASHAIMACRVNAVRSQLHFQSVVAFDIEIFGCGCAGLDIICEHHNTGMVSADAELVFSADHTE